MEKILTLIYQMRQNPLSSSFTLITINGNGKWTGSKSHGGFFYEPFEKEQPR